MRAAREQPVELLLEGMIAEEFVELLARLHRCDDVALRAVAAHGAVNVQRRPVHRAERRKRVERDRDAGRAQLVDGEQRRRPEFGDVGQYRDGQRVGEAPVHRELGDRFRKDHVGAGGDVGAGAVERGGQALDRQRVGSSHDDESGVAASVDGGLDPVDHLLRRHQLLVRPVAAALGTDLVFDVHGRRPGLDQRTDGARHVEGRRAESGVGIDQQRQRARVGDAADVGQHVVERRDAEVGNAQRAGRDPAPGQIKRLVAGLLGEDRMVGADRAGNLQRLFAR